MYSSQRKMMEQNAANTTVFATNDYYQVIREGMTQATEDRRGRGTSNHHGLRVIKPVGQFRQEQLVHKRKPAPSSSASVDVCPERKCTAPMNLAKILHNKRLFDHSSGRRKNEGGPAAKRRLFPAGITSGPPPHVPVTSDRPASSSSYHDQQSNRPQDSNNSPSSKPELRGPGQDPPSDRSSPQDMQPGGQFRGMQVHIRKPAATLGDVCPERKRFITVKPATTKCRSNKPVALRPYRDRIIHLLALRPYKKPELLARLQRDGIRGKDRDTLGTILQQVAQQNKDNSYRLKHFLYCEVQREWPGYDDVDRVQVDRILAERLDYPATPSYHHQQPHSPSTPEGTRTQERSLQGLSFTTVPDDVLCM